MDESTSVGGENPPRCHQRTRRRETLQSFLLVSTKLQSEESVSTETSRSKDTEMVLLLTENDISTLCLFSVGGGKKTGIDGCDLNPLTVKNETKKDIKQTNKNCLCVIKFI